MNNKKKLLSVALLLPVMAFAREEAGWVEQMPEAEFEIQSSTDLNALEVPPNLGAEMSNSGVITTVRSLNERYGYFYAAYGKRYAMSTPVNSLSVGGMPLSDGNGTTVPALGFNFNFGADNPNPNDNMMLNIGGHAQHINQWNTDDTVTAILSTAAAGAAIATGVIISNNHDKAQANKARDLYTIQATQVNAVNFVNAVNANNAATWQAEANALAQQQAADAALQAQPAAVTIAPEAGVQPTAVQINTTPVAPAPTITEQQSSVPATPVNNVTTPAPTTVNTVPTPQNTVTINGVVIPVGVDGYSPALGAAMTNFINGNPPATNTPTNPGNTGGVTGGTGTPEI